MPCQECEGWMVLVGRCFPLHIHTPSYLVISVEHPILTFAETSPDRVPSILFLKCCTCALYYYIINYWRIPTVDHWTIIWRRGWVREKEWELCIHNAIDIIYIYKSKRFLSSYCLRPFHRRYSKIPCPEGVSCVGGPRTRRLRVVYSIYDMH